MPSTSSLEPARGGLARRLAGPALAAFAFVLAWTGCTHKLGPTAPRPAPMLVTPDSIQTIFTESCAFVGCHAGSTPQQGQNLSAGVSYANIVGVRSNEKPQYFRIAPGDTSTSYLVMKIIGDPRIGGTQR